MNRPPEDNARIDRVTERFRSRLSATPESAPQNPASRPVESYPQTYADPTEPAANYAPAAHQYSEATAAYQATQDAAYLSRAANYAQRVQQTAEQRSAGRSEIAKIQQRPLKTMTLILTALGCSSIIGGSLIIANHYSISAPSENLAFIVSNLTGSITICDKTACGQLENIGVIKRK